MIIKRLPNKYEPKLQRDFGSEIKKMREEVGLSQYELAKEIGFESATVISLYEQNKRKPSIQTVFAICSVCGYYIDFKLLNI